MRSIHESEPSIVHAPIAYCVRGFHLAYGSEQGGFRPTTQRHASSKRGATCHRHHLL